MNLISLNKSQWFHDTFSNIPSSFILPSIEFSLLQEISPLQEFVLSIRPVSLKNSLLKVSCSTGVFPDVSSVNNKHAAIFKKMFVFLTKEYTANICRWIRAFSRQQHNVQKQQERCETFPKIILTPAFFTLENSFPRKGLTLRNLFFTLRNLFFKKHFRAFRLSN